MELPVSVVERVEVLMNRSVEESARPGVRLEATKAVVVSHRRTSKRQNSTILDLTAFMILVPVAFAFVECCQKRTKGVTVNPMDRLSEWKKDTLTEREIGRIG